MCDCNFTVFCKIHGAGIAANECVCDFLIPCKKHPDALGPLGNKKYEDDNIEDMKKKLQHIGVKEVDDYVAPNPKPIVEIKKVGSKYILAEASPIVEKKIKKVGSKSKSAYNVFMSSEIGKVKKKCPELTHKQAWAQAAKNWHGHKHNILEENLTNAIKNTHEKTENQVINESEDLEEIVDLEEIERKKIIEDVLDKEDMDDMDDMGEMEDMEVEISKKNEYERGGCVICYDVMTDPYIFRKCMHYGICGNCVEHHRPTICPTCKTPVARGSAGLTRVYPTF